MKPKTQVEQKDEIALEAMKAILSSVYLNPSMLESMADIAKTNQQSMALEIAERSYQMAFAMMKKKASMNYDKGSN